MRFSIWRRRNELDPVVEVKAPPAPPPPVAEAEPVQEPAPKPEPKAEPGPQPEPEAEPGPQPEPQPQTAPGQVSLTIEEAKDAIREAGGDVIQVGFLASAYRRHFHDDPHSSETAASRNKLRDLVGKRLKDRGLLAADGTFELRE
jgi:hypothetical protein